MPPTPMTLSTAYLPAMTNLHAPPLAGQALGDELAGSLSCTLSGSQSDGDGGVTVLTGSMSGTFDVTLTYQTMP